MTEEALLRKNNYIRKYQKDNYVLFTLKCRKDTDEEIINFLKGCGNATKTIRKAVEEYINNHR